jgi:hypothetical protein
MASTLKKSETGKISIRKPLGGYYPKIAIKFQWEFKSKAYVCWITHCGLLILTMGRPMSKNYSGDCTFSRQEAEFREATDRPFVRDPGLSQIFRPAAHAIRAHPERQDERHTLVQNGFAVEVKIVNPFL